MVTRSENLCKICFKKLYFQNVLVFTWFLLIFFIDPHLYYIYPCLSFLYYPRYFICSDSMGHHLNRKLISYCIIFETYIFIEMFICVDVDYKSDSRQGKAYSECVMLRLKSWLEKDAILAGSKYDFLPYPTTPHSTTIKAPPRNKNKLTRTNSV